MKRVNAVATMDPRARYNRFSIAEQQQVYREEIERIWNNQIRSLSSKEEPAWEDGVDDLIQETLEIAKTVIYLLIFNNLILAANGD